MARTNLQIKTFTYTGDGTDNRNITGIGFRPDVVILKGGANQSVFRTKIMRGDSTAYLAGGTANLANSIQELLADGFQVGSDVTANENATVYYGVALRGASAQQYFWLGNYIGNNTDGRDVTTTGISFTPDLLIIKGNTAQAACFRSSTMTGDSTGFFGGTISAANVIQNFQTNGFQLGTDTRANGNTFEYFLLAMKNLTGVLYCGTFIGDGTDSRNITGVGFKPDAIFLKNGNATGQMRFKTTELTGDAAFPMGNATSGVDWIQSIGTDGFQVGASGNTNGQVFHYWVLKNGNFNAPLSRLTA